MLLQNAHVQNQVQRARGIMLATQVNKRCNPRSLVIFPISITGTDGKETHSGIVRDISKEGIFFYSNYKPQLQEIITFVLHMSDNKISGTGQVLRTGGRLQFSQNCPDCEGTGRRRQPCSLCNGKGVTPKTEQVKIRDVAEIVADALQVGTAHQAGVSH